MDTLPYHYVGKKTEKGVVINIYSFKCLFRQPYIAEAEEHSNNIFIVQFYQKNHRDSKNRFNLLNDKEIRANSEGELLSGAKNFLTILNTMMRIMLDIYSNNKSASFGFMGAPTLVELDEKQNQDNINGDGTVRETKRFNCYSIYVKRYFSPLQFQHIEITSSSCYMIKSLSNVSLTLDDVENFFKEYIGYN